MINAELSYNPYLMETNIRFNGQPPRINSLVEKYQNMSLQSWISRIPKIFYDEMNGYYFELDFTGTELDYEVLCNTFRRAGITNEIVPIVHKQCLEDRITKQNEMEKLLGWLETNPNNRFDYDAFRAENSELFDGGYSYVFVHGRGLDDAILKDMNVSVLVNLAVLNNAFRVIFLEILSNVICGCSQNVKRFPYIIGNRIYFNISADS